MLKKTFKFLLIFLFIPILSLWLALLFHELSHALIAFLCKGEEIEINILSYVMTHVEPQYVSYVAIAPLIIIPIITFVISFVKNEWFSCFATYFCVSPIITCSMNLVSCFLNVNERNQWDLLMAIDNFNKPWLMTTICVLGLVFSLTALIIQIIKSKNSKLLNF